MRKVWTNKIIEEEIKKISSSLNHFPSVNELRELGRNDLMCAITKRGGFYFWSEKLGIKRVENNATDFGLSGEVAVLKILKENGFKAEPKQRFKSPYDILVNDLIRCDVKTTKFSIYSKTNKGWYFRIGKEPTCDFVILYRIDINDLFVIPWYDCPHTNITISENLGKYSEYQNNFSKLKKFNNA